MMRGDTARDLGIEVRVSRSYRICMLFQELWFCTPIKRVLQTDAPGGSQL
jgi:hypothetical protein